MNTRIIAVGIALALIIGAGAGYSFSPRVESNPELENQLEEYQQNLRTLENDKLELQTVLASTENENTELQEMLSSAKSLFESIETELTGLESGFGAPDYDSGWTPIDTGEKISLPHGLGTDEDLFVYMIGRYYEGETNQLYYGLCYWGQYVIGAGWTLDDTFVYVERGEVDFHWDEVRVYIWRIPQGPMGETDSSDDSALSDVKYVEIILNARAMIDDLEDRIEKLEEAEPLPASATFSNPDYDSGWIPLVVWPGFTELDHNLGTDDLYVYIIGATGDPSVGNVHYHQTGFGGREIAGSGFEGIIWTINTFLGSGKTINIIRYTDDSSWNYARVLIWKLPPP